jgi:leucyl-tRNA synthetase
MGKITQLVRGLRRNATPEENLLWQNLRNRKMRGYKFLRQHPVFYEQMVNRNSFFVADFYCAEKKLIIELDGHIHDFQKEYDRDRESILKELGLKVIRFKNEELKNLTVVLAKIRNELIK